jgi:hypothetical protein
MTLPRYFVTACALTGITLLTSCTPPAPAPVPPPPPPVRPAPAPPPLSADWRAWPVSAGDWAYRPISGGSVASFGPAGNTPLLTFRCDKASGQISIARASGAGPLQTPGQMTVRTSSGTLYWPAQPMVDGAAVTLTAMRATNDAGLDQIAFSRGRIAIEGPQMEPLVVPVWSEITRVIEDCRTP